MVNPYKSIGNAQLLIKSYNIKISKYFQYQNVSIFSSVDPIPESLFCTDLFLIFAVQKAYSFTQQPNG